MLDELVVANLGLIESASLEPARGLTVISGETGAGKTVMLGALRLLIGEQAGKGIIGPHSDTTDVSARFNGAEEHVVRRVVTQSRSKAYLEGAIGTASALRDTIGPLVAIVGQHDQHTITSSSGVTDLVDAALTAPERKHLGDYDEAWRDYESILREAEALGGDHRELARELETVRYQVEDIRSADFSPEEEARLSDDVGRLRNIDAIASSVDQALSHLSDESGIASIESASRSLTSASGMDPTLEDLAARLHDLLTALSDATADVNRYAADLEADPALLEATEQRISLLSALKRKYGETLEAVLSFQKQAEERERELSVLLASADDIESRLAASRVRLDEAGSTLRDARQRAGERMGHLAQGHLVELGFGDPVVQIKFVPTGPTPRGADTAMVLFASDGSLTPGPVATVASGGELSRLVLALTLASGGAETDTVAFDEIDAGIGGETALAMGRKLAALAKTRQVLCVTHLPQVAAFAERHYVVERSGGSAALSEVSDGGRIAELARMLAGLAESEKGREHAEELLAIAAAEA